MFAHLSWAVAAPAILAAFLASLVEAMEALTIVLAAASIGGWRSAGFGALVGVCALVLLVLLLGPLLEQVPLHLLQLFIGILLLLFGMRWLRKAVLRAAGQMAQRNEDKVFETESETLRARKREGARRTLLAGVVSFKAILLEGLEVVFVVIAVGAGRGLLIPAGIGAIAACVLVACVGLAVRRPLARVPENVIKFTVGVMLCAFGVFWTGEGMGIAWPGADLAIPVFMALFLALSLSLASDVPLSLRRSQ
jgi:uncharacterized membrane protein